jgi:hypothetical protein
MAIWGITRWRAELAKIRFEARDVYLEAFDGVAEGDRNAQTGPLHTAAVVDEFRDRANYSYHEERCVTKWVMGILGIAFSEHTSRLS